MPRVSVIVPVYRHWDTVAICIAALSRQTFPQEDFEVLLVNNDPDVPPPSDMVFPENTRVIDEARKGSYAARNAGVRQAKGEILCFTDADCRPDEHWVARAVTALADVPNPSRIAGKIALEDEPGAAGWVRTYERMTAFNQKRYVDTGGWAATANMCTHASAFDQVGPFNEEHFSGGDQEWGRRAAAKGIPISLREEVMVYHPPRADFGEIATKYRRITGAKVNTKIAKRGLARMRIGYLVTLPFKIIPSISAAKRIFSLTQHPLRDRIKTYWVTYMIRVVRLAETGRILFLGSEAERR
ncbi:glycosyltransferase [Actibacterium lipolyticum]|uniref:Putative glycosyltransferase EpsJ n=1 Tax=Actibacterium lipolyticum TaxID=1524263 RepID=A0A238KJH5_9RHOB|nr:glycosyltransferase [Actibacterium lipolyticum]SMX42844.1 putative glycosyltransferase EpsJ [Actibacterium lipolyticum]